MDNDRTEFDVPTPSVRPQQPPTFDDEPTIPLSAPQQNYQEPMQTVQPKKRGGGLVIGILIGIIVALGIAAALYFFVLDDSSSRSHRKSKDRDKTENVEEENGEENGVTTEEIDGTDEVEPEEAVEPEEGYEQEEYVEPYEETEPVAPATEQPQSTYTAPRPTVSTSLPQAEVEAYLRQIQLQRDDYSTFVCYYKLTDADLRYLTKDQLRILRNTIYAVHGRRFKSADLQRYFNQFYWYTPMRDEISQAELSPVERHNIMLIKKYE